MSISVIDGLPGAVGISLNNLAKNLKNGDETDKIEVRIFEYKVVW